MPYPVTIGETVTVTGFIKERIDKRNAGVCAEVKNEKGELCTASHGDFALFSQENFRKLNIMPEELIDEMVATF